MTADKRKLKRLQKLEKLRAIAKRNAAAETARAEGTLAQLQSLAGRSQSMAENYRNRSLPGTGAELRAVHGFTSALHALVSSTQSNAARAQELANRKMAELGQAERRRSAVAERVESQKALIAKGDAHPSTPSRAKIGTAFE